VFLILGGCGRRAHSMHGENRNTYKVLSGKLEKKRKLERPRPRCEDNIDTDRDEIGR